jgi:hypothetical protein
MYLIGRSKYLETRNLGATVYRRSTNCMSGRGSTTQKEASPIGTRMLRATNNRATELTRRMVRVTGTCRGELIQVLAGRLGMNQ